MRNRLKMKIFLGTDVCEIERIHSLYNRFGDKFLNKIYTQDEIQYCLSNAKLKAERLSARFAAKEAGAKALGTGIQHGVSWKELEVRRAPGSRPILVLSGRARAIAGQLGVTNVSLSLTHTASLAMATVHLEV